MWLFFCSITVIAAFYFSYKSEQVRAQALVDLVKELKEGSEGL
jgi:preprotein translocase subunit YajC